MWYCSLSVHLPSGLQSVAIHKLGIIMIKTIIAAISALIAVSSVQAAVSPITQQPHIEVSLLSDANQISVGGTLTLGLHLNPDEDWHVYWKNPGDSGMPPSIRWNLPEGVSVSEIQWPYPEKIPFEHLINYGYHSHVVLPVELTLSEDFKGDTLAINATASWLVCKESCIPGDAKLALSLPVKSGAQEASKEAGLITEFKQKHPAELSVMGGNVAVKKGQLAIELYAQNMAFKKAKHIEFFATNENLIEYNQPATVRWNNNFISISQDKSASFTEIPAITEGVLVVDHKQAWHFKLAK